MDAVAEGSVIGGRYRLGPRLGWGGMAEVYDAFDERLARRVAVKLLRQDLGVQPEVRRRFEAEARAAARLSHPNVVAVHDTGEDRGRAYIVMERLPGETLADRFSSGPVSQDWLRQVAIEVLAALGAAHAAGIIHRDVKPTNILIASDGTAKVADFGIAKTVESITGPGGQAPDLTAIGMVIGTPGYLAPERIDGRAATPQSDLYAVGVVLYEGLTGRQPFAATTPLAIAYLVRHEAPPDIRLLRPDAEPSLIGAISRAMAHDPKARFSSAGEMSAALRAGVAGVAGVAGGAGAAGMAGTAQAATTAFAPPLTPETPLTGAGAQTASPGAPTTAMPRRAPPPGRRRWLAVIAGAVALGLGILALSLAGRGRGRGTSTSSTPHATAAPTVAPTTAALPTTSPTTAAPADLVGPALAALAGQLTSADGSKADALATGLSDVAAQPAGSAARSKAATDLLLQATSWYGSGDLTQAAYAEALSVLQQAGASLPAPITTTTTIRRRRKG